MGRVMRKKLTLVLVAAMLVVQTVALSLVNVKALTQSITVRHEWNDSKDHTNDKVTVQLYKEDLPVEGKVAVLTANTDPAWQCTFNDLKGVDTSAINRVNKYSVKVLKINDVDINQLVSEGKYKKPKIAMTDEGETVETVTRTLWTYARDFVNNGKYAFLCVDVNNIVNDHPTFYTLNHNLEVKKVNYDYVAYTSEFTGLNDDNLWTVGIHSIDGEQYFTFTYDGKKLTLQETNGLYEFVLSNADDESTHFKYYTTNNAGYFYVQTRDSVNKYLKFTSDGIIASDTADSNYHYVPIEEIESTYRDTKRNINFTITNSEIDAPTSMTVKKEWNDNEDHFNDTVTVQLTKKNANGDFEKVEGKTATLSAKTNPKWEYTFKDLDVDNVYYVEETKINGKDIDQLVKDGKYEKPDVKVTKGVTEDVDVENSYWIKVTEQNVDGTAKLEDGETYAIVTNDWIYGQRDNRLSLVALAANHQKGKLDSGYVQTKTRTINGEDVECIEEVEDNQQWKVTKNSQKDTYSFINNGKYMTIVSSYPHTQSDQNSFALTDKAGNTVDQTNGTQYQSEFQVAPMRMSDMTLNIIYASIYNNNDLTDTTENNITRLSLYMNNGNVPMEHCYAASGFNFYKKVTVPEKESVVVKTPNKVTITNKTIKKPTVETKQAKKVKSVDTGDNTNILPIVVLMTISVACAAFIVCKKRKQK